MEKEKNQVKKLKLNVTTIKNFLFGSNKTLKKTKTEKFRLIEINKKEDSFKEKEKKIETPNLKSPLASVKSLILAGPMSIFDKIKEFFGIILLGLIVNNLPQIIQKIQDFFNNPFIQGTLKVLKFMGKALYEIIKSVIAFPESTQKTIKRETDEIKKNVDELMQTFGFLEKDIDDDLAKKQGNSGQSSGQRRQPPPTSNNPSRTPTRQTVPLTTPGAPAIPTPQAASQPPYRLPISQSHAKGGTVKKQNKFVDGGTVRKPQAPNPPVSSSKTTSFSKKESGKLKKANKDVTYFESFNRAVKDLVENSVLDTKNNSLYEDMVNNFKKLTDLMKGDKKKTTTPPGGNPPGGKSPGLDLSVDVKPDEIVGYVGNTGVSGAAHIHIEDYEKGGTAIPQDVKSSILVAGNPMTSGTRTSEIGPRKAPVPGASTNHKGEDWDQNWNGKPISLTGGLKFVDYVPMGTDPRFFGYGNVTVIKAPNGRRYFLGHLSKGPKDIKALRQRQLEIQRQNVSQDIKQYNITGRKEEGKASFYGGPTDKKWEGRTTAGGDIFNSKLMTAASNSLPLGSIVRVTNKANGKSVIVKVNDTGGFTELGRIMDLSAGAMKVLGGTGSGVIDVKVDVLEKKPIQKMEPPVPARLQRPQSNAQDGGDGGNQASLGPLNTTDTQVAMVMTTQPIIQPYPVPYMVPMKSSSPPPSAAPSLAGAWSIG